MNTNFISYKDRMNLNYSNRMHVLRKRVLLITICIISFVISLTILTQTVSADNKNERVKKIISVEVQSGDTLWTIAENYYSFEYNDLSSYIEEIMNTNQLTSDSIHSGSYLVVPYYTDVDPSYSLDIEASTDLASIDF